METAIDEDFYPFGATNYPVCERNSEINKMIKEELEKQKKEELIENIKNYADGNNNINSSNNKNNELNRYESIFEIIRKMPSRSMEEKTSKRRLLLEFHNLRRELDAKKIELEEGNRQLDSYKTALSLLPEPKHYLIAKLRDEENEKKNIMKKYEVNRII